MTSSPADRGRLDETLRAWADAMRRFAPAVLLAALLVTIGAAIVTIRAPAGVSKA